MAVLYPSIENRDFHFFSLKLLRSFHWHSHICARVSFCCFFPSFCRPTESNDCVLECGFNSRYIKKRAHKSPGTFFNTIENIVGISFSLSVSFDHCSMELFVLFSNQNPSVYQNARKQASHIFRQKTPPNCMSRSTFCNCEKYTTETRICFAATNFEFGWCWDWESHFLLIKSQHSFMAARALSWLVRKFTASGYWTDEANIIVNQTESAMMIPRRNQRCWRFFRASIVWSWQSTSNSNLIALQKQLIPVFNVLIIWI